MALEFHCADCGKLLRVADEFAGRQACCPNCGAVTRAAASSSAEQSPTAGPPAELPETPQWAPPEILPAAEETFSPYQPPRSDELDAAPSALLDPTKVAAPAIALMIAGGVDLVVSLGYGVLMSLGFLLQGVGQNPAPDMAASAVAIAFMLAAVAVAGSMIYGGLQMRRFKNYLFCVAAAIVAIIPCFSFFGCCFRLVWDIPIGIWALVILLQGDVRQAFREHEAAAE